ncbi:MAG TPA: hypothetical protein PKZ15_07580, partial [Paludibacteraceae bacterium]|nr:hypothetical protein [Paludibacteraceae bacterium]
MVQGQESPDSRIKFGKPVHEKLHVCHAPELCSESLYFCVEGLRRSVREPFFNPDYALEKTQGKSNVLE